ncbi:T9SS type A sorting domain-containing protein [Rufibacter glacialis]|nr:T9SS type A sorting domain-containing protein [Rufibacter glacialis]
MPQTLAGWYALQDPVQTNPPLLPPKMVGSTNSLPDASPNPKITPMSLVNYIHNPAVVGDRSFGFSTGNQGNPIGYYGVRVKNDTGAEIKSMKIEFDVKLIHDAKAGNGLVLSYQVGSNLENVLYTTDIKEWQPIPGVFSNKAETHVVEFPIQVAIGQEFFIRLVDTHNAGNSGQNDDDLAIDNFQITSSSTPGTLPVTFTSFTGSRSGEVVNLAWATASEKENDFFEVQQSEDGKNFTAVGEKVKGAGTTAVAQAYKTAVSTKSSSILYFRLKQVDFDGKFEHSKVIVVKGSKTAAGQASHEAYPNPTPDKVYLTSAEQSGSVTVTLFHSSGRAVSQRQVKVEAGTPITLDLAGQAAGVYYVQVHTASGKSTTRVVKQ